MARDKKTADMIGRWLALAAVGLGVTEPGPPGRRGADTRTGGRSGAGGEGQAGGTMAPDARAAPVTDGPFIETKEAIGSSRHWS